MVGAFLLLCHRDQKNSGLWPKWKLNFMKENFPSMAPFIRLCWLWWPSNEAQARSSSWFPWIKPTQHYDVLTSMVTILLQSGSTGNIRHLTKLSPSQSSDQNVTPQEQWKNCSPTPQVLPRGEEGLAPSSNIVNRLLAVKTSRRQERGIRGKKVESRQSFGRGAGVWRTKGWYVGINGHWTLWRGRRRLGRRSEKKNGIMWEKFLNRRVWPKPTP